jgi:hypothetical protein
MSDPGTIRDDIVERLDVVLPGRAYAYPPTSQRYVTPSVFVEQITIVGDMTEPTATFPVWVITDGSVQAQVDAHDGIVWNVWLAMWPLATRLAARPMALAGLRASVIEVDVPLDAFGLCGAPEPTAYQIA